MCKMFEIIGRCLSHMWISKLIKTSFFSRSLSNNFSKTCRAKFQEGVLKVVEQITYISFKRMCDEIVCKRMLLRHKERSKGGRWV